MSDNDTLDDALDHEVACLTALPGREQCRFASAGCMKMLLPWEHEEHCRQFYDAHLLGSLQQVPLPRHQARISHGARS